MRHNYKFISFVLGLVLLLTQVALAQHSSVHLISHEYALIDVSEHSDGDTDHHHDKPVKHKKNDCPICLSGKIFAGAFIDNYVQIFHRLTKRYAHFYSVQKLFISLNTQAYYARGPPTFFI